MAALDLAVAPAVAAGTRFDPTRVCDAAAAKAEHDWGIPSGLLAAIGFVESGRPTLDSGRAIVWPWSVDADGQGFYAGSRTAAIRLVMTLQARGARYIDVGCFQVDLAYHGTAFSSLEEAFDPDANAQAAARILAGARFRSFGWAEAVALYHSSSPWRGALYLRRVRAALPAARSRLTAMRRDANGAYLYAPLLSPQARLVRVLNSDGPPPAPLPHRGCRSREPRMIRLIPSGPLPRIVTPTDEESSPSLWRTGALSLSYAC